MVRLPARLKRNCTPKSTVPVNFEDPAPTVAKCLIGMTLLLNGVGGVIVETEAYDQTEPASHAYRGPTARNAPLYGPPGTVYIYRSYGIHWCLNIVCRETGHAAGVLLRAIEPTAGIPLMMQRRGSTDLRALCSGPGKIGEALAVTQSLNGCSVLSHPFSLTEAVARPSIVSGTRIGISRGIEHRWRFGLRHTRYTSRPF
jgi:DNA-3-methyladenine glycosylase